MCPFASRRGRRLLAACLVTVASETAAQDVEKVETSVQAAYLYQFTRFVEWPEMGTGRPLVVCVVGKDPFGPALDRAVQDRRAAGRRVTVRRVADPRAAADCNLAFLPAAESSRLAELQDAVGQAPVLLVGDGPRFAQQGGMIAFYREEDRVRFEVNTAAAESVGLRISSRLLGIARVVGGAGAGR